MIEDIRTSTNELEQLELKEDSILENIPDDYKSVLENPINHVLSNFGKTYNKNERMGRHLWSQLKDDLKKFKEMTEKNPDYETMDIVKLFDNILKEYLNWVSWIRQNTFLGRDKMKEVYDVIKKEYIPKKINDAMKEEYEILLSKNDVGLNVEVQQIGTQIVAIIPTKFRDYYAAGTFVNLRKIKGK